MSSFMCLLMHLFNCVCMCLVIYFIVIALCFSLNYVSLPCILFLFMQLQSRYIRKNHLLSRSCYLFSFLLSFFLAFFLSFFHCLEFIPADLFGGGFAWFAIDLHEMHFWGEFEVPHSRAGSFQDFETWQDSLRKPFEMHRTFSVSSPFVMTQNLNPTSWCWFHLF